MYRIIIKELIGFVARLPIPFTRATKVIDREKSTANYYWNKVRI
jgi:hypothetical protein